MAIINKENLNQEEINTNEGISTNENCWSLNKIKKDSLVDNIFNIAFDIDLVSRVIIWQQAKSRSGNHKAKNRSEINATTKKSRAQKRTGKSRQGSLKAPQHRGGGAVFGPVVRSHAFKLNKKVKNLAIRCILSNKVSCNKLFIIDDFNKFIFTKTKDFNSWLNKNNLSSSLFVVGNKFNNLLFFKIVNNKYTDFILSNGFNALDAVKHENIILDKNSLKEIVARYSVSNGA